MKKQRILKATVSGLLTGPLFVISAVLLDMMNIRVSVLHPILISLLISGIYLISHLTSYPTNTSRSINKQEFIKTIITAILFFALFSYISLGYTLDFLSIGPKGKDRPMLYLLFKVKYEGESIISEKYWERVQWSFYKPECYSEVFAVKLKNHSLEIAGFYYGGFKTYPLQSLLKSGYRKLFCDVTDLKMAYENYKKLLVNSGFSISENPNSFMARNESTVIYCRLDGRNIMVAKAEKTEEDLLENILTE